MNEWVRVGVICAIALWFALIEIEIEGAHGWALRLPTWFRTRGPAGRLYGAISGGKPLTGYHLFMATLPLLILQLPFAYGEDWSLAAEVMVLATYLAFAIGWDYLWFILNPAYGLARFRSGRVWWYSGPWVGRLPAEYYAAVAGSFALAAVAWALGRDGALAEQGRLVLGLALLCLLAMAAAPLYMRWHRWMRRPEADEHDAVAAAVAERDP